jgi:adenine-specific DNA-methyltransferase
MSKSLLEQLPQIVADGKREAERVMERLESSYRIGLQTRELVIPSRDTNAQDMLLKAARAGHDLNHAAMNRLIYGDNLLTMAALLAGDDQTPSMRGKVDLIYIDPPFDSKTDYRTKVTLPGGDIEQRPTAIEQFAYSDTWHEGTKSYLESLVPLLYLLDECLSPIGSAYLHLGKTVSNYVKVVADANYALSVEGRLWGGTGSIKARGRMAVFGALASCRRLERMSVVHPLRKFKLMRHYQNLPSFFDKDVPQRFEIK